MNCAACQRLVTSRDVGKPLVALARRACLSCDPDAANHKGASHVEATDFTLTQRVPDDNVPQEAVTTLSPDQEDKLRKAMHALFALDAIDLLLVQHLMRQQPMATFGNAMDRLADKIRRYHGRSGAMAFARKERLLEKFAQISAVITTDAERSASDRVKSEIDNA